MLEEAKQLNSQPEYLSHDIGVENSEEIREKLREYYFKLKQEAGKENADFFVLEMVREIEESEIVYQEDDKKTNREEKKRVKKIIDLSDKEKKNERLGLGEFRKRVEGDKIKSNFIKKLEENGVIEYIDGNIILDFKKIAKREFYHVNLGRKDGGWISGSQKMFIASIAKIGISMNISRLRISANLKQQCKL